MKKIDIVYQATGQHAWCIRDGWTNNARRLGLLNRVFEPKANWGDTDTAEDDGLFEYLANPQADVILLLGFDWHSQPLHTAPRWKERWLNAKIRKILYLHESVENNCLLFGNDAMRHAALSAAECSDLIVCPDPIDRDFFVSSTNKPVMCQPYGVDDLVFTNRVPFDCRKPRAFFRGNTTAYQSNQTYSDRRALITHLTSVGLLDLLPFDHGNTSVQRFVDDYNNHQIAINFPSLSIVHSTRVFESMACGCALVACRTERPEQDALFEHGKHVLYYRTKEELRENIERLINEPKTARALALAGRDLVTSRLTIGHHLRAIMAEAANIPLAPKPNRAAKTGTKNKSIVVDGVIFQIQRGRPLGISRVWHCLLKELSKSNLGHRIVVLDRDNTAPRVAGIRYRSINQYRIATYEDEPCYLQQICTEEEAELFFSTYYTWPERTPSVLMIHDMIAEARGMDLNDLQWQTKGKAIERAFAYLAVSEATIRDFKLLYPQYQSRKIFLTPNSVADEYRPRGEKEVELFRRKYQIEKPYFILSGMRVLYKNAMLFFKAFQLLENRRDFEIICTGSTQLEPCFLPYVRDVGCKVLFLSDEELAAAFTGAIALVYPSQYEGFGLPIVEAQKSGCPVITCKNSAIPEVAGDAVIYVGDLDVLGMKNALQTVCEPATRASLIQRGVKNANRFSWRRTGELLYSAAAELLEDAAGDTGRPIDLINSTGRFAYFLKTRTEDKLLSGELQFLNDMLRGNSAYDEARANKCEATIRKRLGCIIDRVAPQIAPLCECESLLSYVMGIALDERGDTKGALQRYIHALKGVSGGYHPSYKRRLGLRLGNISYRVGEYVHAKEVLQKLVLSTWPEDPEALLLVQKMESQSARQSMVPTAIQTNGAPSANPTESNDKIRVSAIVSTYNSERFIRGCLEDLIAQTLYVRGELEIIVVDSASCQNERAIVREFQKENDRIVYIRSDKRETVYASWNRAIKVAKGKYLTNANADDRHRRDALEVLAHTLDERPAITLVYGDCIITQKENATFDMPHRSGEYRWLDFNRRDLLEKGCFVGPQPMWRSEVHAEHGLFEPDFVSAGDYEFWLRIARTRTFLHVKETLGLYLDSPTSVEHANQDCAVREVAQARERHRAAILGARSNTPNASPAACRALGSLEESQTLFNKKHFEKAWAAALGAIKSRPFHPDAYLLLAEIALAAGSAGVARRCAEHCRSLAPSFFPAKRFLKRHLKGEASLPWLRFPEPAQTNAAPPGLRLSVCMIVKNEERFIAQCLQSVKGLAHQIVVVDTGSTDRTVQIAKEHGAEVHSFSWCDDFSAARNSSLEHATGEWILVLDADEELPASSHAELVKHMSDPAAMAWRLPILDAGREDAGQSYVPRLFRNAPGVYFSGRIHEHAFGSVEELRKQWGLDNRIGTARLIHHGYTKELTQERGKVSRNLRLLELAVEESPHSPLLLMNLGLELCRSNRIEEGITRYRAAFAAISAEGASSVVPELREMLLTQFASYLSSNKRHKEVIEVLTSQVAKQAKLTASLHYLLGMAYVECQQFAEAAEEMRQCLARRNLQALTPVIPEIRKVAPRHCLALCHWQLKESDAAIREFQNAISEAPASIPLHLDYAKFLGEIGKVPEALQLLHGFVSIQPDAASVWLAGGRIALSRPDLLEVATDWTSVAVQQLPSDKEIKAQRAEALLFAGQVEEALPLWRELESMANPSWLGALVVCEAVLGHHGYIPTARMAETLSKEFMVWYWRLVEMRNEAALRQILEHIDSVSAILPGAGDALRSIIKELNLSAAV